MKNYSLSIVIPCLNEEETIWIVVKKWLNVLKRLWISWEVLVSDNGSNDRSREIAEGLWARVVNCPSRWYGNALKSWFSEAKWDIMIMGDADDSYNFEEIDPLLAIYEKHPNVDIVIWNRLAGYIEKWAMPWLHRYLGTPVLTFILNLFFKVHIGDCNCGMRLITKKAFEKLQLKSDGMEFASEMMIKAGLHKMKIIETPINLYKDKRSNQPHLRTWTDGRRHLRYMLLLAPHYLFFGPGTVFSLVGLLLLLIQVFWSIDMFGVHMDIHYMILWSTLAILWNIALTMWILIQWFSENEGVPQRKTLITNLVQKISLEKWLIVWLLIFIIGLGIDATTLYNRLHNFSNRNPEIETRKAIIGWYSMVLWLLLFFFSFANAMIRSKR